MTLRFGILLPALALAGASVVTGAFAQGIAPADYPGPLRLAEPVVRAKAPGDVFIVQLRDPAAASYGGGTSGFAATKPAPGERFDANAPAVENYAGFLERAHDAVLAEVGGGDKLYSYSYSMNGFAARLTPAEVTRLARHSEVIGIWRDIDHRLQTNNSSLFLGLLDQNGGLRADLGLSGEDVIIGVIDSGIDPTHPALRDYEERVPRTCRSDWAKGSWLGFLLCFSILRDPPTTQVYGPPSGFSGICQEGEGFPAGSCNNKLIGARYFNEGFLERHQLAEGESLSPRDVDGHGTHIATIAAGNHVTASLFGARIGEISGIAPRARIVAYKACWLEPGASEGTCTTSDLARAIDAAVADGVDIINYSIGSLETDLTEAEDIALLNAFEAGVLPVVAAGNNGPANFTLGSPGSAPWVLTVAASTQTGTRYEEAIEVTAPEALAGLVPMREASFTPRLADIGPVEGDLVLVDDGQDVLGGGGGAGSLRDACEPPANGGELDGNIALIERGGCTFKVKLAHVESAGAAGAVVYTPTGEPTVMNSDSGRVGIPAVMIGPADGDALVDAFAAGDEPAVRLAHGVLADIRESGNRMADFSSRGPALGESDFVKPDLTAPGVEILAGTTQHPLSGLAGRHFEYRSGTSMAAPMVAGIAALLRQSEPDWSPGRLKSALMTTSRRDIASADPAFRANPFDMGSGHVVGNDALDPGLVYEIGFDDYRAWLCGADAAIVAADDCAALETAGFPLAPESLNLPSIGVTELIPGDVITRRLTNVGPAAVYDFTVSAPPGVVVDVEPSPLSLGEGETAEYRLRFDVLNAPYDFWQFGSVEWSDGTRVVHSPIAVQPVPMRAPRDLELDGLTGAGTLPLAFGYTGDYVAGVHGLHAPGLREAGFVADDPDNDYSFRFDAGVSAHFFTLDPGELFVRVSLFDALTDGDDDLDLYVYHCPTLATCTEVGQSGSFTSDESVELVQPEAGLYAALVHGFETDETGGGPGASYEILGWSFGPGGDQGNLSIVAAPDAVTAGERLELDYDFGPLDPDTIWLGGISHTTPLDRFYLTIVTANMPGGQ